MIAIDYQRSSGEWASDIYCDKCMATKGKNGMDPIYDGDARRPATEKDARLRDSNAGRETDEYGVTIECDGCGEKEEVGP